MRLSQLNYCSESHFCLTALNLRAEAIVRSISDAIFLLSVTCSSSPNVYGLSQWRILLLVRTISYVEVIISVGSFSSKYVYACARRLRLKSSFVVKMHQNDWRTKCASHSVTAVGPLSSHRHMHQRRNHFLIKSFVQRTILSSSVVLHRRLQHESCHVQRRTWTEMTSHARNDDVTIIWGVVVLMLSETRCCCCCGVSAVVPA